MTRYMRRGTLAATALACLLFATACSSGKDGNLSSTTAPRELTAKPAGGSPGIGPLTPSDTTSAGGKDRPQQVVLTDRVLIVDGATVRTGVGGKSTLVGVDLTIQSRGPIAIANEANFFEIMGPEGDIFAKQSNSSGAFYGTIDPHKSRSGRISFEIPLAATSSMRLLYRPDRPARTVIVPLTIR
jgi:hypothetical protein